MTGTLINAPKDWETVRTRFLFAFTRGYPIGRAQMSTSGIPCIHYGDIHGQYGFTINLNDAEIGCIEHPSEFGIKDFVHAGQFLFAGSSEDYEGSGNFTLVQGKQIGVAGTDTIVLTPKTNLTGKYFAYLFDSSFFREQIRPHMMGTKVFHPSQKVIKNVWCILPPHELRESIVEYLDERTAQIDSTLKSLERQVELLERYRRELIARTVTRGLNPDAPMRDSGVDWIGKIPSSWQTLRISALYSVRSEKVSDRDYEPLSVTMNGILPQLENVAKTNDGENRKLVRAGDFVINSRSDRRGACGISSRDGSCSLINTVLAPQAQIYQSYFGYLFSCQIFSDEFYRWGHGIHNDLWTTNWADMKTIQVPVPSYSEQIAISEYLDAKTADIDSSISKIKQQIELLGKYRKQVINDAVTGKIRVGGDA